MTWTNTWKDILNGGPKRWKIDDLGVKQRALAYILAEHANHPAAGTGTATANATAGTESSESETPARLHILCPLAGDDPFVQYVWSQGHSVTAIDLVPQAVEAMRHQFGGADDNDNGDDWKCEENGATAIWRHKSGRATLYQGDMLAKRSELLQRFDAVYDKDSFGALDKEMRPAFCQRLADYTKEGAIVYIEVKYKEDEGSNPAGRRLMGPPFHVEQQDLMEPTSFGTSFDHVVSLGEVFPLNMPGMSQTAHILKRVAR
jgi:hypothetical protein